MNSQEFIEQLSKKVSNFWINSYEESKLIQRIMNGQYDKYLYARYLIETFHYTTHNSKNQALVALNENADPRYAKFCLHHAEEETGHELMALHDLNSIGFSFNQKNLPCALPMTEVLIAYLYRISTIGNPLRRLGYSFWAESVYSHIGPILKKLSQDLNLSPSQMSFFVNHAGIDADHSKEVNETIHRFAKTQDDFNAIEEVALTSLRLTLIMIEQVEEWYTKNSGQHLRDSKYVDAH